MTCNEVQAEIARDAVTPTLTDAMHAHLAGCLECRTTQLLFSRIDERLKQGPAWEPPLGFAHRVAALAPSPVPRPSVLALFLSPGVLRQAFLSLLLTAAAYSMPPLLLAGVSLAVAAWWTRRAIA